MTTMPYDFSQAEMDQLWDQNTPEGILRTQKQGQSRPSGSVVGGQYWDYLQGKWVQAPTGTQEGTQWNPGMWGSSTQVGSPGAVGGGGVKTPGVGAPGIGGGATVNTSIVPRDIYTPEMTQQRVNQASASAHQQASMPHLLKQFDSEGVSRSGRNTALALPQVAQAYGDAAQAQAAIPLADEAANQQNRMRGEIAQGLEFNQLARLLLGQQSLNNWVGQQNMNGVGGLMGSVLGMI